MLRVSIYVTTCWFVNENLLNHKICQIAIRRSDWPLLHTLDFLCSCVGHCELSYAGSLPLPLSLAARYASPSPYGGQVRISLPLSTCCMVYIYIYIYIYILEYVYKWHACPSSYKRCSTQGSINVYGYLLQYIYICGHILIFMTNDHIWIFTWLYIYICIYIYMYIYICPFMWQNVDLFMKTP